MKQEDFILKDFNVNLNQFVRIPLITIYSSPADYPGVYVARLFDIRHSTKYIVIRNSLSEISKTIPPELTRLPRYQEDDPAIVETYV